MAHTSFVVLALLLGLSAFTSAATISWTGTAGNSLWNFPNNWLGNAVPTANDDVVINALGGAAITISQPAYARSLYIGGVNYAQSVTLLSSISVGAGGVTIANRGTLQLSGNTDLPFASVGNVTALNGGSIIFNSGEITGPGLYTVNVGASIVFSGSALKLIKSTSLNLYGTTTIQPTSIQLANSSKIANHGAITALGSINIFSNDNTKSFFYNYGQFNYQGGNGATLTFQLGTYFSSDLNIQSGSVILADTFLSTARIVLPQGTTLTINSGATQKIFGSIVGAGSVVVQGTAEVIGTLSVSVVTISESGSLSLEYNSTAKALGVRGVLLIQNNVKFIVGDVSAAAGTISGAGELLVSGNFEIAVSPNGNTNTFISALVTVYGSGYTSGSIYILFSSFGTIHIVRGASFKIGATVHILKQSGSPAIINDGAVSISLNSGSTFYTNVDFKGTGTISIASGLVTFATDILSASTIGTGADSLVTISSGVVTVRSITGVGSVNITSAPLPSVSMLGNVTIAYLGVPNGVVQANYVSVDTLELWNGELRLGNSTASKATIFNFYGGAIRGKTIVDSAELHIEGVVAHTVDGTYLRTKKFFLRTIGSENELLTQNGAQIVSQA